MLRSRLLFLFCVAACSVASTGCGDATRDNPLDPLSDDFRDEGAISGRVTGIYPPFPGRPGVQVRLIPVGPAGRPELATRTDDDGRFALSDIPAGAYAVLAEEQGFVGEADTLTVEVGTVAETTIQIDALPVVLEQNMRSVHILRWPPLDPAFQLEVEATATDPDRPQDLAGASFVVPDLGFSVAMDEVELGRYAATFDENDLPAPGIEALLGQPLRVEVRDASGNAALGPVQSLVRVIEQSPQTQSPQWPDQVSPTPTLVWRPAQVSFEFTYRVDVSLVNAAGVPNLVASFDGIDPNQTSLSLTEDLVPSDYFWTVWIVDAVGNRSRSREAGFIVP